MDPSSRALWVKLKALRLGISQSLTKRVIQLLRQVSMLWLFRCNRRMRRRDSKYHRRNSDIS
jgi:hypothetical protein